MAISSSYMTDIKYFVVFPFCKPNFIVLFSHMKKKLKTFHCLDHTVSDRRDRFGIQYLLLISYRSSGIPVSLVAFL